MSVIAVSIRFLFGLFIPRPILFVRSCCRLTGSVCASAGGIPGIEASNGLACCKAECGQCGGTGCSTAVGGAADCCVHDILVEGEACSVTGAAPCYIDDGETQARWETELL